MDRLKRGLTGGRSRRFICVTKPELSRELRTKPTFCGRTRGNNDGGSDGKEQILVADSVAGLNGNPMAEVVAVGPLAITRSDH